MKKTYNVKLSLDAEEETALTCFGGTELDYGIRTLAISMAYFTRQVLHGMLGKLTLDEAKVILSSLRHLPVLVDAPGKSVKDEIRLAVLLQDVALAYNVEKRVILEKVDAFTFSEVVAIAHWANGYWKGVGATGDREAFDYYAQFLGAELHVTPSVRIQQ